MHKMIAIAAVALVATLAASAAIAMNTRPAAEPTPAPTRQAVAEYDALGQLVNQATLAIQPHGGPKHSATLPCRRSRN